MPYLRGTGPLESKDRLVQDHPCSPPSPLPHRDERTVAGDHTRQRFVWGGSRFTAGDMCSSIPRLGWVSKEGSNLQESKERRQTAQSSAIRFRVVRPLAALGSLATAFFTRSQSPAPYCPTPPGCCCHATMPAPVPALTFLISAFVVPFVIGAAPMDIATTVAVPSSWATTVAAAHSLAPPFGQRIAPDVTAIRATGTSTFIFLIPVACPTATATDRAQRRTRVDAHARTAAAPRRPRTNLRRTKGRPGQG